MTTMQQHRSNRVLVETDPSSLPSPEDEIFRMPVLGGTEVFRPTASKRRAVSDPPHSNMLKRRNINQLPHIVTPGTGTSPEPVSRSASLPAPEYSPITQQNNAEANLDYEMGNRPRAHIPGLSTTPPWDGENVLRWLHMQDEWRELNGLPGTPTFIPPRNPPRNPSCNGSEPESPFENVALHDHLFDDMLKVFAERGVPTDAGSGSRSTAVARASAQIIAGITRYAQTTAEHATANFNHLLEENKVLRTELATTHNTLFQLQDDFNRFQRRPMQTQIKNQIAEMKEELAKLRAPDVTIEQLSKQIKDFDRKLLKQDKAIDGFKEDCAKELKLLSKSRLEFNKEVSTKKKERKTDLRDLEAKVDDLVEKMEINKEDAGTARDLLVQRIEATEEDVSTAWQELQVLRKHVEDMGEEEDQKWEEQLEKWQAQETKNKVLSAGLYTLKYGDV